MDFSGTTSSEVVWVFTKFSNGKTLREISVLRLDRDCFKVSVAANRIKIGVLSKLVNKHRIGRHQGPRDTLDKN